MNDDKIKKLLESNPRVAVLGISAKPQRASHHIATFLAEKGLDVVGVNPVLEEVQGIKVYPTLADIPGDIDLVDVFRKSEAVPMIVDACIAKGVGNIWLQEGVAHPEAEQKAIDAGMGVVSDLCIYKEWLRLL
jgi:uncharacterized protein